MVLYPTLQPNPVLPMRSPGFSGGRGMFPRGTGGIRGLNWRAEGLRVQPPRNELQPEREEGPSTSGFYRQQREVLPEGHTEECLTLHPPSTEVTQPQRMKTVPAPAAKGRYTDPTLTPIPRDEPASMDQEGSGKEEDSPGYATPPEGLPKTTQQLHTALSNQLDRALQEALDKPGPSCLRKQGGGDREPTPSPQALKQGETESGYRKVVPYS